MHRGDPEASLPGTDAPQGTATPAPEYLAHDPGLSDLLESGASAFGHDCFATIARTVARVLSARYVVIAEFLPESDSARSLVFCDKGQLAPPITWPLEGTPCRGVVAGEHRLFASGVADQFPADTALRDLAAESYLGLPMFNPRGGVLGHLFAIDTRPMPEQPRNLPLLRILAARAASELLRLRMEQELADNESRLRDLFDEAPIAYVHEGLDSRFIRANRTAMRILGITPDQVQGTFGSSFIPDTPDAQRRLKEAFDSIGRGVDTSGVVLELRRRDNGKPIWIQWWSRPDPGGQFTRTMFIDITDRVLLEQEQARLQAHNLQLREEIKSAHNFGDIVGRSPALMGVIDAVQRVAPTDSTVLIQGETGTGKELVARAIHEASRRSAAPFIKVNCAALPAGLVESEFFGHEKGAFTGAVGARKGRFELADGGTIFLDEVGEVSPEVQVKLLRVLQESEFERVGGSQTVRVNVRVIAATNRDLAADFKAAKFRADLYYRLGVFPIDLPPLRQRASDIPLLAAYFVTHLSAALGRRIEALDLESVERLRAYAWPGNIRELRNVLERAIIRAPGPVLRIDAADLGDVAVLPPNAPVSLEDAERAHIRSVLARTGGVVGGPRGAAKVLGMPPSTLRSAMARLGIKP